MTDRAQELLDYYVTSNAAFLEGRLTTADEILSSGDDLSLIGTAPDEWIIGREAVREAMQHGIESNRAARLSVTVERAEAWTEGDMGWVISQQQLLLPNGHEVRFRVTTIFRREDPGWRGVHQHVSLGVPDSEVEAFQGL